MKRIYLILIALVFGFMLQACTITTYPTTQDDIYTEVSIDEVDITGVDMNVIIRRGRPYYYSGTLLYYLYQGIYYYPYYYDNYWYFRAYRRPFPYTHARPYFRPHRYDYRFHRDYIGHRNWYRPTPQPRNNYNNRNNNYRYNHNQSRPDVRNNSIRPDMRNNHQNTRSQTTRPGSISRPSTTRSGFGGVSRGGSRRGGH